MPSVVKEGNSLNKGETVENFNTVLREKDSDDTPCELIPS